MLGIDRPPENMFFGLVLNDEQETMKNTIMNPGVQVILCDAVSGAGKTLMAVACARMLQAYHGYDGVVYVFSANQEQALGYRPGTTEEKIDDYLQPLEDALVKINEVPNKAIVNIDSIKMGTAWIDAKPSTFLRGVNFNNKVVIIDECQNFTVPEIKKVVSRADSASKIILIGSNEQIDIEPSRSCFRSLIHYLKQFDKVVECKLTQSYRSWLCEAIDAYHG